MTAKCPRCGDAVPEDGQQHRCAGGGLDVPAAPAPCSSAGRSVVFLGILLTCGLLALVTCLLATACLLYFPPGSRGGAGREPTSTQEPAADRERRFEALLEEARASLERDPAAALKKLEEADQIAFGSAPGAVARLRGLKNEALWLIALDSEAPGKPRDEFVHDAADHARQRKRALGAEEAFERALERARDGARGEK